WMPRSRQFVPSDSQTRGWLRRTSRPTALPRNARYSKLPIAVNNFLNAKVGSKMIYISANYWQSIKSYAARRLQNWQLGRAIRSFWFGRTHDVAVERRPANTGSMAQRNQAVL